MNSTSRHSRGLCWLVVALVANFWLTGLPSYAQVNSPPSPAAATPTAPIQNPNDTPAQVRAAAGNTASVGSTNLPAVDKEPDWAKIVVGIAWPVSLLMLALGLAYNQNLARLLGLSAKVVRKIKAGGVEMEISADAVDQISAHFRASIDELVNNARIEYDRMSELTRVYEHLESAITVALRNRLKTDGLDDRPAGLRGTVHVKDIVFREYLYQLVDYYPSPSGAGRRFSQRYGIIGRSWRLGRSLGEGDAISSLKGPVEALVEQWGMLRKEAHAQSRARPSYLSIILRGDDNDFPVGIFFVDATEENAFGDNKAAAKLALQMEKTKEIVNLGRAVERAMAPLQLAAPNIDIGRLT